MDAFDPGAALHRAVASEQVIGTTIYSACTVVEPGMILLASGANLLVLGDVDGSGHARSEAVADLVRRGGLPCRVSDDIRAEVWSKLTFNLAGATTCLLTRRSFAQSYSDPIIRSAAVRVVKEGLAVAAAVLGHPLSEDANEIVTKLATLDHKPSILQDFERGRPMEIDALLTRPHQLAQMTHVATPMLDLLTAFACQAVGVQAEPRPTSRDDHRRPPLAVVAADCTQPVLEHTVGEVLRLAAARWGERIALQEGSTAPGARQWTFTALLAVAERVARTLLARFAPGQHVALAAPNCPEWAVVEFGAALAGIVLVTINPALTANEFAYVLRQSRSCGLVVQPNFRDRDILAMTDGIRHDLPHLREVITLDALYQEAPSDMKLPETAPGQIAQIQYMSGTTGFPKSAMLTHRGLINNARFYAQTFGARESDVWINPMPMFHTAGGGLATLGALQTGGMQIIAPTADAGLLLDLIAAYGGTVMLCVPTMLIRMLDHPQAHMRDVSSWRVCTLGGALVAPELVRRAQAEFGLRVSIGYGQTEASPYLTHTLADDSNPEWVATVGRPLPQTEIKIVTPGADEILPCGVVDEIVARSYGIMQGYFDNEEATRAALGCDGWLRTGDLGSLDALGYLRIQGS
jgi:fatty-acyl-CoA synthase